MSEHISWLLEVTILPGKLDEFRAVARDLIANTEPEPGTLDYEWHNSPDNTTCHIFERYADSAAMMKHVQGFHNFAARFMAACRPTRFSVYGKPSAEAKAALADLGPVYFSELGGFSASSRELLLSPNCACRRTLQVVRQRAVPACAVDLGKGLACRGRCEEEATALINFIQGNVERATLHHQIVDASRKNRYLSPIFMMTAGTLFGGFGLYQALTSRLDAFCIFQFGLGGLFIVYGFVMLLRVVAMSRMTRAQTRS